MRVAIAGGAGGVGSSLAFNLLIRPEPFDVVVIDRRPEKVLSHVMDLEQVLALGSGRSVRVGDWNDLADADAVVVCAATALTANTSRSAYLRDNAAIVRSIAARLDGWGGVLVMVTNPVDVLCTMLAGRFGRRLLGYTFNDSLRLRTAVSEVLDVPVGEVSAWVLGEHGEAAVPLWSRVTVGGAPVALTAEQRAGADQFVRGWYARHVALDSRRSSTWTTGAGVAALLAEGGTWVASVPLQGEYGLHDVCLGVPVRVGPGGAEAILDWELAPGEHAALHAAAAKVRAAARS